MPTYAFGCVLQSYDYKIKLEHVKRLYLLPEIDEKHMMFVVRDRPWPPEELGASKGKPRARSYRLSVSSSRWRSIRPSAKATRGTTFWCSASRSTRRWTRSRSI